MTKQYSEDDCWRKANQEWEMAGMARRDGDHKDAEKRMEAARRWEIKARRIARGEE